MSDATEDQIRNAWETMHRVMERLAAKGITIQENPPPFPMPEVTTTLVADDNQDYLKTNAKYLAWLNYLLPYIALVEGILLETKNEKTDIEVSYREAQRRADEGKSSREKRPAQEVEDATKKDPRYMELCQYEQEMMQERNMLEAKKENLARVLRVISRHVEVKKLDAEMNKIGSNLPARRPFNKPAGG